MMIAKKHRRGPRMMGAGLGKSDDANNTLMCVGLQ